MPYNFNLAVSAEVSASVAHDMIRKIVEEQTGKKVASVETKLRMVSRGIGPSESNETIFDGFHIIFEAEKSTTKVVQKDSGFQLQTYD